MLQKEDLKSKSGSAVTKTDAKKGRSGSGYPLSGAKADMLAALKAAAVRERA